MCFCMCISAHMCMCARKCVHIYTEIILGHFSTLLIEAGFLSQSESLGIWLISVSSLIWEFPQSLLSELDLHTGCCSSHLICTWVFGELNSGPDVWVANTLTAEQSLQSCGTLWGIRLPRVLSRTTKNTLVTPFYR